jgi:hypothetical protein
MNLCADALFLIALYDPTDAYHDGAPDFFVEWFQDLPSILVLPWPIMYETVKTRLARRPHLIAEMDMHFSWLRAANRLEFVDDSPYREHELDTALEGTRRRGYYRPLSLADRVIRRIISEQHLNIHGLITLNDDDFSDICYLRGCDLMSWRG